MYSWKQSKELNSIESYRECGNLKEDANVKRRNTKTKKIIFSSSYLINSPYIIRGIDEELRRIEEN